MARNKKIRVLWFVNTFSLAAKKFGVTSMSSGSWIEAAEAEILKRDDVELAVAFLLESGKTERFIFEKRTYYSIRKRNFNSRFKGLFNRLFHAREIHRIGDLRWVVNDFRPDIIHVYGSEGPFGLVAELTDVPVVLRIQGLVKMCTRALEKHLSAWKMFYQSGVIYYLAGYGFYHQYLYLRTMAKRENGIICMNKYFIGQTQWDEDLIRLMVPNSKYFRLNSTFRSGFFTASKYEKKNKKKFRILTIINPALYKGFETVLQVAKILKDRDICFEWRIAGTTKNNPTVKTIEKIVKNKFAGNRVNFLGVISEDKIINEFQDCDIYVHPSHIENDCNSIIEAMILGVPVVANFVGGISSTMVHEKTGIFVPDDDYLQMVVRIIHFQKDRECAKQIGTNARRFALKTYNSTTSTEKLVKIYREILDLERKKIS